MGTSSARFSGLASGIEFTYLPADAEFPAQAPVENLDPSEDGELVDHPRMRRVLMRLPYVLERMDRP